MKDTFFSGKGLSETIAELQFLGVRAEDVPAIEVFTYHNRWYSLNNRRLYVFKQADSVESIPVIVKKGYRPTGKLKRKIDQHYMDTIILRDTMIGA